MRTLSASFFLGLFGSGIMLYQTADAATESVLYSFKEPPDANAPAGGLAVNGDTIYGASPFGGPTADGAIFAVTTSGVETIVHSFKGGGGGQNPQAGFIMAGRALYGTVAGPCCQGSHYGQVVRMTMSGREHVVYQFKGEPSDGAGAVAPLLYRNGTFYGTTQSGGGGSCNIGKYAGCGTVFSVTPTGAEKVLYSFTGEEDGADPMSQLVWKDGRLYGTAAIGGSYGFGVVFSVGTTGEETVLHSFKGKGDGATPEAGLLVVGNLFYGTTGGGEHGKGTVFSITKRGDKKLLYRFQGGGDGAVPTGDLINVNGTFYGTTYNGGGGPCNINGKSGCGTVFSITPDGIETVLYAFQSGPNDGAYPQGPLMNVGGSLYGVTVAGGSNGLGTVFVIKP